MAGYIPKSFQQNIAFIGSYTPNLFSMYADGDGTLKYYSLSRLWTPNWNEQERIARIFADTVSHIEDRFNRAPAAETQFTLLMSSVLIEGFNKIAKDYWKYETVNCSAKSQSERLTVLCEKVRNITKEMLERVMDPNTDDSDPLDLLNIGLSSFELKLVEALITRKYGKDVQQFVSKYSNFPHGTVEVNRKELVQMIKLAEGCTYRLCEAKSEGIETRYLEALNKIKELQLSHQDTGCAQQEIPPAPTMPAPPSAHTDAGTRAASSSQTSSHHSQSSELLNDIQFFGKNERKLKKVTPIEKKSRECKPLEGLSAAMCAAVDEYVMEQLQEKFKNANAANSSDDEEW